MGGTHSSHQLQCLKNAGLTAKPQKCKFGMRQCSYLDHIVGGGVVQPDLDKVKAVELFQKKAGSLLPMTDRVLQKVYTPICQDSDPLTDLTKDSAPNIVVWSPECDKAFQALKTRLCSAPVLISPDFSKEFVLQTDTSETGIGAVLSQVNEQGQDCPVAYIVANYFPESRSTQQLKKSVWLLWTQPGHTVFTCWEDHSEYRP